MIMTMTTATQTIILMIQTITMTVMIQKGSDDHSDDAIDDNYDEDDDVDNNDDGMLLPFGSPRVFFAAHLVETGRDPSGASAPPSPSPSACHLHN